MADRLRLLKRIRTVCRTMQWLLLVVAISWGIHIAGDYVAVTMNSAQRISDGEYALKRALWDRMDEARKDLALLGPSENDASQTAWVDSLVGHFGDRAGIFLLTSHGLDWRKRPTGMDAEMAKLAVLVADSGAKVFFRKAGFIPVRRILVSPLKADFDTAVTAVIAGDPKADRQWGVLYRHCDLWQPLVAELHAAQEDTAMGAPPDPLTERLGISLDVKPLLPAHPEAAFNPTFRVTQNGELLYASPGLDTTKLAEADTIFGARVEIYNRRQDADFTHLLTRVWLGAGLGFLALLFAIFELIYRWAGRLRKSEPVPTDIAA